MTNPVVTVELLEQLTHIGDATLVSSHISSREYDWKTMRYHCAVREDPHSGTAWVVEKVEPRTVHVPEPPSVLQRVVDIVAAEHMTDRHVGGKDVNRLKAYDAIVDVLLTEGLLKE
jgi:hypothetical protein